MSRKTRSDDWGFPRWRGYGSSREAVKVRLCDRFGCTNPGDRPAPKAPNSPERWWFFTTLQHFRSRDEMRALDVLGLEIDADFEAVKAAWRSLAKENHPDVNAGDANAEKRFQAVQTAYEVLKSAEERRLAL